MTTFTQNIDKIRIQVTGLYGDQTGQTFTFLIPISRNQRLIREAAPSAKAFLKLALELIGPSPIKPLVEIKLLLTNGIEIPFTYNLDAPVRITTALLFFSNQLAD